MLPRVHATMYLSRPRAAHAAPYTKDYLTMIRKLFSTMTALGLLVTACGDDKGTTDATTTASSTGGEGDTTSDPPSSSTGPDTPTTAGMSEAMTSTTNVDPSTTDVDPSTSTSTGPDPDTTTPETTDPETTEPETGGTTIDPSGGDPVEQCKMMADPMTECSDCVCENCLEELQACQADEGCTAIRMCAEETGCTGLDCLDVCGDVIDEYGGPFGPSGMLGLEISMCLMGSCDAECNG